MNIGFKRRRDIRHRLGLWRHIRNNRKLAVTKKKRQDVEWQRRMKEKGDYGTTANMKFI